LVFLTHGHWDHTGSLYEIKELTGCKVAINHREKAWVEQAIARIPPGANRWGKVLWVATKLLPKKANFPGTDVDIALNDEEFSLESYGIRGRIIYTPGHTFGSMSLLLETGEAFVGDLCMNGLPMRIGPGMPTFAEDVGAVKESWRILLREGAKWIYPAHGKSFKAEVIEKKLSG